MDRIVLDLTLLQGAFPTPHELSAYGEEELAKHCNVCMNCVLDIAKITNIIFMWCATSWPYNGFGAMMCVDDRWDIELIGFASLQKMFMTVMLTLSGLKIVHMFSNKIL